MGFPEYSNADIFQLESDASVLDFIGSELITAPIKGRNSALLATSRLTKLLAEAGVRSLLVGIVSP
ncbi:hypothetical protein [Tumidithrix helvetica]|uniref:hypothetical protein n=1 Tax=Tumidithrix helvetica TaxID=3457545 RepID=UPI003CC51E7A